MTNARRGRCARAWIAGAALIVVSAMAPAFAGEQDEPAYVVSSTGTDLQPFEYDKGTVLIGQYITRPNLVAGKSRLEKDKYELNEWPYWYEEIVYVTRGKGEVTLSMPPFANPRTQVINEGDFIYIAIGMKVSIAATTEEPLELIYIASPDPWALPQ